MLGSVRWRVTKKCCATNPALSRRKRSGEKFPVHNWTNCAGGQETKDRRHSSGQETTGEVRLLKTGGGLDKMTVTARCIYGGVLGRAHVWRCLSFEH